MESFLCGGLASTTAICLTYPIDVVKTRFQFQGELTRNLGKKYNSVLGSVALIFRHEGLRGLYLGFTPMILLQFSVTSSRFGIYTSAKSFMSETDHLSRFGLSMFSSVLSAFAGSPFYLFKTQFQVVSTEPSLKVGTQHAETGIIDAAVRIWKTEGFLGFWTGGSAFMGRCVAYGSVQLSCYEGIKQELLSRAHIQDGPYVHVASSLATSFIAVSALQPFDIIAVRLMNQPEHNRLYQNFRDCGIKILRAEGLGGLFKGYAANYARMGPHTVLTFLFFEQYKQIYRCMSI